MSARKQPMSAVEFNAKLQADPDFISAREAYEQARRERLAAENRSSEPLLSDLASVGVVVDSVWDLAAAPRETRGVLPVLLNHLEQGEYPSRVMEGIGRALAVKESVVYWGRVMNAFEQAADDGAREGAAAALDACATKGQVQDLIDLLRRRRDGDSSYVYFLKPVMKLGGDQGRAVIASLVDDPVLGKEATALMKRAQKSSKGGRSTRK